MHLRSVNSLASDDNAFNRRLTVRAIYSMARSSSVLANDARSNPKDVDRVSMIIGNRSFIGANPRSAALFLAQGLELLRR
jgi:hypothetical protein